MADNELAVADVKYFEGIVKLENVPSGLRPGMTAEVKIALPRVEHVLAVPSDAVRVENGHDFCFVVHEDGLERREVKLGQVTSDLSEVTEGLEEGEQVVINPPKEDLEPGRFARPHRLDFARIRTATAIHRRQRSPHCTDRIRRAVWSG